MKRTFMIWIMVCAMVPLLFAKGIQQRKPSLKKATTLGDMIFMDINRLNGMIYNNGIWFNDVQRSDWGLEWPKGSQLSPFYGGGQWIGAKVNNEVRVASVIHDATEFQPGIIKSDGTPDNPNNPAYRWYVLEPDGVGDWNNWPVNQGAPVDADGKPLLLGDKTAFCVWNDMGEHLEFATNKLGSEIRQTLFAFNRADAIGDMVFIKWQIINKGSADWDSTYLSIWADPDIGDGNDDFVGSDPELGLGYCYNATNQDQNYGAAPPAVGVDFFQGPIIDKPGSTVTLNNGTVLQDKTMLKMTAFIFYNNNDSNTGNPFTSGDVWNYMRGYWKDKTPITDPSGVKTPFMFNGDPETNTGWLDSDAFDRRFLMTTGPFSMKRWKDTNGNGKPELGEPGVQEIVAGLFVARGSNNLNSVTLLKAVDGVAQRAYDINFALPSSPKSPNVQVSESPNSVVLTWDSRSEFMADGVAPYETVDLVANGLIGQNMVVGDEYKVVDDGTFNFARYRIYQYSDASGADPVLIGGSAEGYGADKIKEAVPYTGHRFTRLAVNKNPAVGNVGDPLINGREYYFGVRADAYCEFAKPSPYFTSPVAIVRVTPRYSPGVVYNAVYQDTLPVSHNGKSDGSVVAWVVDPSKTTGQSYRVTFNPDMSWNLLRGTPGDSVLKRQTNQTGDDAYNVVDGILVKVAGPVPGININIPGPFGDDPGQMGWSFSGTRWVSWGTDWGGETWYGSAGNGTTWGWGGGVEAAQYVDVKLNWAGDTKSKQPDRWQKGYVYRRDKSYAYEGLGDVPFTAWDMTDPAKPRQLNVCFVEMDGIASANKAENKIPANGVWDMGWHILPGDTGYAAEGGREYIFLMLSTYDPTGKAYNNDTRGPRRDFFDCLYAIWPGTRVRSGSDSRPRPFLQGNWDMTLFGSKVNTKADVFSFTAPGSAGVKANALKADIHKINVVPNPYYGYHNGEMNAFNRWVQFTFLPAKCTVRIFDLAGNLIRRLDKDDASTPFLRWDMKNEYQLPVASGIYVYHVDVPNVGEKVGKMAIFAPNERLDTY